MQNNLSDLNNHLFSQLELLESGELRDKDLDLELKKAKAISQISSQILNIARLQIAAINTAESCGLCNKDMPALIATKDSRTEKENQEKRRLCVGVKK